MFKNMSVKKWIKAATSMLCVYKYTDANANPHTPVIINLYIACSKESHSTACAIPNIKCTPCQGHFKKKGFLDVI